MARKLKIQLTIEVTENEPDELLSPRVAHAMRKFAKERALYDGTIKKGQAFDYDGVAITQQYMNAYSEDEVIPEGFGMTTNELKRALVRTIGYCIDEETLAECDSFMEMDQGVIHFCGLPGDRYFRVMLTETKEGEYFKPYDPERKLGDAHHTMDELYNHRCHLFVALMRSNPEISWRAGNHNDGTNYPDWFIAGMHLPSGDISYHLPMWMSHMLDDCGIESTPYAPIWDGHTPEDVVNRLAKWFLPGIQPKTSTPVLRIEHHEDDTVSIEGTRYDNDIFRNLGCCFPAPVGHIVRIDQKEDGVITATRIDPEDFYKQPLDDK